MGRSSADAGVGGLEGIKGNPTPAVRDHAGNARINRDIELGVLRDVLAGCAAGASRTVVVEGGVGCGKTELLDAVVEQATVLGAVVLRAEATPLGDRRPLYVLRQLARGLSPSPAEGWSQQGLAAGGRFLSVLPSSDHTAHPSEADEAARFCEVLRSVTQDSLLVVCVDDRQHADTESLHHLLGLANGSSASRILLLVSELPWAQPTDPVFATELLRQSNLLRIRLGLLDRHEVEEALALLEDVPQDERLVESFYKVSGGNPLLVHSLVEEYRTASPEMRQHQEIQPTPGGSFGQAILTCLYRSGPAVTELAGAVAVLGDESSPELLSQMLGSTSATASRGLRALDASGLLVGCRLRHPAAEMAVLDSMSDQQRVHLHRRAAELLHSTGVASPVIARHLLEARQVLDHSEVGVLLDAAERALADDDVDLATAYLELAYQGCSDRRQRACIKLRLGLIMGRVNLSAAERHLDEPLAVARSDGLSSSATLTLLKLLVTHGRLEEAMEMVEQRDIDLHDVDPPTEVAPKIAILWTRLCYPQVDDPPFRTAQEPDTDGPSNDAALMLPRLRKAMVPWLGSGRADQTLRTAEQFLEVSRLTDDNLVAVASAVKMLIFCDRPDKATLWCGRLLDEAMSRGAPGWLSALVAVRSLAWLRQGKLMEAVRDARQALDVLPESQGSTFPGAATNYLVLAYTEMGSTEAAARHLDHAVTDTLLSSFFGLGYLSARGRYRLATDRPHAGLSDFLRIGEVARRWGMDHPILMSWRTDAAEAWLRLAEPAEAARLLAVETSRFSSCNSHIRGTVLRLKAATVALEQRPGLLTQAVEELQASGDRLELARALADLGDAHRALGDLTRARTIRRRAWHIARDCRAQPLCERIAPSGPRTSDRPLENDPTTSASRVHGGNGSGAASKLSNSERRVAVLAARGHTNQQIAEKLYITVSTVEQHLTRVYRKLDITGRDNLPADLRPGIHEIA